MSGRSYLTRRELAEAGGGVLSGPVRLGHPRVGQPGQHGGDPDDLDGNMSGAAPILPIDSLKQQKAGAFDQAGHQAKPCCEYQNRASAGWWCSGRGIFHDVHYTDIF